MPIRAANSSAINAAALLLTHGELVAFPTETVYGLGADATSDNAVAKIFAAKRRPRFNPLISHVPDRDSARALGRLDHRAERVAEAFWPGPLTLVVARAPGCPVSLLATAGLDTVALRVPAHEIARALLLEVGRPLAAPSANRSGRVSPTSAQHVAAELDDAVPLILDGGPCRVGLESTVLDLATERPVLLRPGGITAEQLEELLGPIARPSEDPQAPRSPGMLASHYAPSVPVRPDATQPRPGEALLAFGPVAPEGFEETIWLSRSGDLVEAAANLFVSLRELDRPRFSGIAVMPIPERGLGVAINDRLRRAAAPRPAVAPSDENHTR